MKFDDRERRDEGRTRIAWIWRMGESQAILGMGGRRAQNDKKIDLVGNGGTGVSFKANENLIVIKIYKIIDILP